MHACDHRACGIPVWRVWQRRIVDNTAAARIVVAVAVVRLWRRVARAAVASGLYAVALVSTDCVVAICTRGLADRTRFAVCWTALKPVIGRQANFEREASRYIRLQHPNTLRLFDYGQTEDGQTYIVTEILTGETLKERLDRLEKEGRPGRERKRMMRIGVGSEEDVPSLSSCDLATRFCRWSSACRTRPASF